MKHFLAKWRPTRPVWLGFSANAQSMTLVEWCDAGKAQLRWAQETGGAVTEAAPSGNPPWEDPARLGAALAQMWQRAGMRCQRLAMGVPADRLVQHSLQVEAGLPARELRSQVQWSASQSLALAWNQVAFDYRIEKPVDPVSTGGLVTVQWLACPMAWVQAAQQISRAARLRLQFLGVEPPLPPLQGELQAQQPPPGLQWSRACEIARQAAQS